MPLVGPRVRWMAIAVAGAILLGLTAGFAQPPHGAPPSDVARLYESSCANCHGTDGRGSGPAANLLNPLPRDFTRGIYKFRSTSTGSLPTDDDLYRAIASGFPGTSMPAWKDLLSDAQMHSLVAYTKSFSPRFTSEQPTAVKLTAAVAPNADTIAKGRKAYATLACGACHGDDGTGAGAVASVLQDDWGHPAQARNLTEPWTFRGGSTAADIYTRLKTGIDGTPMPSYAGTASDQDLWSMAHFVTTLARKPVWSMNADEVKAFYERQRKQAAENPVERGRYLVDAMGCGHCHSPVDAEGRILPGMKLAGGQKMRLMVWGDVVTPNLTSDNETGIGRYSDQNLKLAITRGIKRDGSRMLPFPMGWSAFATLNDADLNAIIAFLRTVPAVSNRIPPPERPGFFRYLSDKFQMLILKRDFALVGFAGNAGSAGAAAKAAGK